MADDIVARLRELLDDPVPMSVCRQDVRDALGEIERLRDELAEWKATVRAHDALAAENSSKIEQLQSLIKELLPYMIIDMEQGLIMGPPPSTHPDDNCPDCQWYKESLTWKERIDSGEFREFRVQ